MFHRKPKRIRKLQRLPDYDYYLPGQYFITICTQYMMEWFGDVVDGQMKLNECGEIVKQQLFWLPKKYPYVQLDEWVVMPNHIHAIIHIKPYVLFVGNGRDRSLRHDPIVSTIYYQKSLPSLVGAFKTTSSKRIHLETVHREFLWQKSFHDHIIQSGREWYAIRQYIRNNPRNWHKQRYGTVATVPYFC